ncbi:MAG: lytic transglycosylase domain-containing protein [Gammaproteobacteria bacterium]
MRIHPLALFLLLASVAAPAAAEKVQVYRKADGTLLFTNRAPAAVREPGMLLLETRVYKDEHYTHKPRAMTAARRDAYDDLIADAASRWGVEFALVKAVVHAESAFDKDAVSRAGARGLMQLMPATASMLKVSDIHDPYENINGGARYLRMMLDRFKGNVRNALAAYNAGEANVKKYGGIPPFPETKDYVAKVVKLSEQYRDLTIARR